MDSAHRVLFRGALLWVTPCFPGWAIIGRFGVHVLWGCVGVSSSVQMTCFSSCDFSAGPLELWGCRGTADWGDVRPTRLEGCTMVAEDSCGVSGLAWLLTEHVSAFLFCDRDSGLEEVSERLLRIIWPNEKKETQNPLFLDEGVGRCGLVGQVHVRVHARPVWEVSERHKPRIPLGVRIPPSGRSTAPPRKRRDRGQGLVSSSDPPPAIPETSPAPGHVGDRRLHSSLAAKPSWVGVSAARNPKIPHGFP